MSLEQRVEEIKKMHLKPHRKPWYRRIWLWFLLVFLFFFSWAVIYVIKTAFQISSENELKAKITQTLVERKLAESPSAPSFGASEPLITIVEFGDYTCPFTQLAAGTIWEAYKLFPDDIKIIWRDLPWQEDSLALSLAGRCFHAQGQYEKYYEQIFLVANTIDVAGLEDLAKKNNLDLAKFKSCLESETVFQAIKIDSGVADLFKIEGTPTWLINGHRLTGNLNKESFINSIKEIINENKLND